MSGVEPEQYLTKVPHVHMLETRLLRPDAAPLCRQQFAVRLASYASVLKRSAAARRTSNGPGTAGSAGSSRADRSPRWPAAPRPRQKPCGRTPDVMRPGAAPFTWSLMRPQLEAIRAQYRRWPVPPECQVIRRFWGRLYFNMSLFQQAAYTLYGTTPDKQIMQLGGAAVQVLPPWLPVALATSALAGQCPAFGRLADRVRQAAPASFAGRAALAGILSQIPPRPCRVAPAARHVLNVTQSFLLQHLYLTTAMSGNFSHLRDLLTRLEASTSSGLVAELMTGLGDVSSAEQSYRLWELSRLAQPVTPGDGISPPDSGTWQEALADTPFLAAWQGLDTYGHRCLYEVEMANPRWREQPDYLFECSRRTSATGDRALRSPGAGAAPTSGRASIMPQAAFWWRPWLRIVLRTQAYSRLRENGKSHLVRLIDIGRSLA